MLPWQKGLINKGWTVCIKVLKSCMKSKYWNYVGCTDHRAKEVSHENLTCMKQSQRKTNKVLRMHELISHWWFWGVPAQHRDFLTGCKLCFTLICPFPIILIWRLSKAPAHSSVSFWILHMFLKRWLHRNVYKWWQTTPYAVEVMLSVSAAIPSKTQTSPFAQTKWYQPCPVVSTILHIALSASKSSFSSQGSPGPGRWGTPHPHPHVLPSSPGLGHALRCWSKSTPSVNQGWDQCTWW